MSEETKSLARLRHEGGYRFRISFENPGSEVLTDEPLPLGSGEGPNPSALLGAAVGNCLAASLLFCMRKARLEPRGMEVEVEVSTVRNEGGRLRIGRIDARLVPEVTEEQRARMGRCVEVFESFCTVTESVREGIPVNVRVEPRRLEGSERKDRPTQTVADGTLAESTRSH